MVLLFEGLKPQEDVLGSFYYKVKFIKKSFSENVILKNFFYMTSLLILLFSSSFCYASDKEDFIFVAEIPVHVPFQRQLSMVELLEKERVFAPQGTMEPFQSRKFRIKPPKKPSKPWRGKLKLIERTEPAPSQGCCLNYTEDLQHIRSVIHLFQNESFGATPEISRGEFSRRMRLVLLANRMESIFSLKNHSLSYRHDYEGSMVMNGFWEPCWESQARTNTKWKDVDIKEVREYMHSLIEKLLNESLSIKERQLYEDEIKALINQEEGKSGHVPYHELRECLRKHPSRNLFIGSFVRQHPQAQLYEATHDDDLVGLRLTSDFKSLKKELLGTTGLYTHYLSLLRELDQGPDVLTTGHRVVYEADRFTSHTEYAWIYQVIEEDRYARAEASRVDFRASYISEPNCLYKVPKGKVSIPYSFLILPNECQLEFGCHNKYAPCESLAIMRQIYSRDSCASVHFDPVHPVLMKIPQRMLNYKNSKTAIRVHEMGGYNLERDLFSIENLFEILKLSSKISQSPFSYRDYAITLYRQLDMKGSKTNYDLFISLICTIFNYFDLKNYQLRGQLLYPPSSLRITYTDNKEESDPEKGPLVRRLNQIKSRSVQEQLRALERLMDERYGAGMGNIIIRIAKAMGQARINHYEAFLLKKATFNGKRTSPKKAIEQSPVKQESCDQKPNKAPVRRELFPKHEPRIDLRAGTDKRGAAVEDQKSPVVSYLAQFFKKQYERALVTQIVSILSRADIAGKIERDPSTISKLGNPRKYGSLDPSARLVWGLFSYKTIEQINELGFRRQELLSLATVLGYS